MLEAQPIAADAPPVPDLAAEPLRVLQRMREMALERLEALSERAQLAREDGRDQALVELSAAADKSERSLRQIILLDVHLAQGKDVRIKERAERKKRVEARKAEIADKLVDALDRPEYGRERVERLYVEMDAWLAAHDDDPGLLDRPVWQTIEAITADLGVDIDWIIVRPNAWSEAVLTVKPPHRTGPPLSARSRRPLAKPP
jgi:hypothetical protein